MTAATEPKPAVKPLPETWSDNERMRHIPPLEWMIDKLGSDLRRRVETFMTPLVPLASDDPRRTSFENGLRLLCRLLDRLADAVKPSRGNGHPPNNLDGRFQWSIDRALASLRSLDPNLFGRRCPFQTFERSKAEPIYSAVVVIVAQIDRLVPRVRVVDPSIDERLYGGLVRLQHPLPDQPIA